MNLIAEQLNPSVLTVAAFLKRHHPTCRHWPRERILPWLLWAWDLDAVACVTNGGRLTAVGVARPIRSLDLAKNFYHVDFMGPILWIDVCVALNENALALLLRESRAMWGERALIAFYRRKKERHCVMPWRRFMSWFTRKES